MGAADYVKSTLLKLGATMHFNKLNMKPGKPTTFASMVNSETNEKILFFGLPGNPVSCLVTKTLFVDPAMKRQQGLSSSACLHAQVKVRYVGDPITLDVERPEYHRVFIFTPSSKSSTLAADGLLHVSRQLVIYVNMCRGSFNRSD